MSLKKKSRQYLLFTLKKMKVICDDYYKGNLVYQYGWLYDIQYLTTFIQKERGIWMYEVIYDEFYKRNPVYQHGWLYDISYLTKFIQQERGIWMLGCTDDTRIRAQQKAILFADHKPTHLLAASKHKTWFNGMERSTDTNKCFDQCLYQWTKEQTKILLMAHNTVTEMKTLLSQE